ncbi:MAG TPA: Hpt domain-containing protein, partial [Noviherbaspirillum sp.]|nr:Hpt domain-containing protein [Noviherbaspirillum sp.]
EQALAAADAGKLAHASHRFLSSIENLGALRMRAPCVELERIANTGHLEQAPPLLRMLQDEFAVAREHLRVMTAEGGYARGRRST